MLAVVQIPGNSLNRPGIAFMFSRIVTLARSEVSFQFSFQKRAVGGGGLMRLKHGFFTNMLHFSPFVLRRSGLTDFLNKIAGFPRSLKILKIKGP